MRKLLLKENIIQTPDKRKIGLRLDDFFEDDKDKAETYECIVCNKIFSDNYNLECNHCICINCINNYEKCPEDETDIISGINAFNQSFIGDELLNELKVYCVFRKKGCSWSGKFEDFYSEHLNKCKFNCDNNDINNFDMINDEENYENIYNNEHRISDEKMLNRKRKLNEEKNNQNQNKNIRNNNILNLKESNFSIFQQKNIINNIIMPLSQNNNIIKNIENINKENNPGLILEKYFDENYNNNITIDSNLTMDIFPYYYYFTEPLNDNFNCKIETISRSIEDDKEISFGITNIDNGKYTEIISTKNNLFLFIEKDIIQILYDSNIFYINSDNGKFNKQINFEINFSNIKYYPTIILNNAKDILKVSHK